MQKKFQSLAVWMLIVTLILGACAPGSSEAGEAAAGNESGSADSLSGIISVSGAFALYPMMTVWADEFHKLHPEVEFDVQGGGAGKGMTDTIAGAVDIGMISRDIKPEEEAQGIFWVSVTKDAVFPIVSSANPALAELTAGGISPEIFNKIFVTAEVTTWGQVVGKP
jgi:phosphate transport system substrate-binding protein